MLPAGMPELVKRDKINIISQRLAFNLTDEQANDKFRNLLRKYLLIVLKLYNKLNIKTLTYIYFFWHWLNLIYF